METHIQFRMLTILSILVLSACTTVPVARTVVFADGAKVQCYSYEARTSDLNAVIITSCEPAKTTIQTYVSSGQAPTGAIISASQSAALTGTLAGILAK